MFKRTTSLICLAVLSISPSARAELDVVATLPDLGALAKEIGGEHVTVTVLVSPDQDPHYVDARPNFMVKLNKADLVIANGLQLEVGWLPPLLVNARNPKVQPGSNGYLDASQFVDKLQTQASLDRALGDIHPGGNPHFLQDPRQAIKVAEAISDRLATLDPDHGDAYRAGLAQVRAEIDPLIERERLRFQALPEASRRVVTYHLSLIYLWDWLGIEQVATLEPRPGIAPEPGHVASVLKTMRKTNTKVIVQESYYQTGPSQTLAKLAHASVVVIPGGANVQDGQSYVQRIEQIAEELYRALSK